eukprot:snap_masked-scaffold_4-processed-gene-8.4-mRNA-1 protein AED:0.94 eAED:0.95 QI:0/0/0/0.33/1/1/3/0/400
MTIAEEKSLIIQCFLRCMFARVRLKKYFLANIERVLDEETGYYFFFNLNTNESAWEIPSNLHKRLKITRRDVLSPKERFALGIKIEKEEGKMLKRKGNLSNDAAAKTIQSAFRASVFKRLLKNLSKEAYVKIYDEEDEKYFFYNRFQRSSTWTKPIFLCEDDVEKLLVEGKEEEKKDKKAGEINPDDLDESLLEGTELFSLLGAYGLQKLARVLIAENIDDLKTFLQLRTEDFDMLKLSPEEKSMIKNVFVLEKKKKDELLSIQLEDDKRKNCFPMLKGVKYERIFAGKGDIKPQLGWIVKFNYISSCDGEEKELESTFARKRPIEVRLEENTLLPGLQELLLLMEVGERGKAVLDPVKCYGINGLPPLIPPGVPLHLEIELLDTFQSPEVDPTVVEKYL